MPAQQEDAREQIRSKLERQFVKNFLSTKHNRVTTYRNFPTTDKTIGLEQQCKQMLAALKPELARRLRRERLRILLQHEHGYYECVKLRWFDLRKLTEILLAFVEDGESPTGDFIRLHVDDILSGEPPSILAQSPKDYLERLKADIYQASKNAVDKILREDRQACRRLRLQEKADSDESRSPKEGKQAPNGLPPKKINLNERYFEGFTERQAEIFSLRFERGMTQSWIARRLRIDRKTVYGHLEAASRKVEIRKARDQLQKNGAKSTFRPSRRTEEVEE